MIQPPGGDQWIEFEELDPGGAVCGARRQGAGTYGFGSAAQALAAAASPQMTGGSPPCVLCESREEIGFFTSMSRLPADIWAVRVDGLWVESGPEGWMILPGPVPPERLRLLQG